MSMSFQNKVALVTGAGSGMGLVTARIFAEAGAAVALSDVNENAVRSAADQLVAAGHKAIGIRCNVADEADVETMVAQTVSTFGRLDAAFNNAGVQSPAKELADVSGEEFERVNGIMCPGWVCTDMGGSGAPRSVQEGADTAVWLATEADQNLTGKFFRDRKEIGW